MREASSRASRAAAWLFLTIALHGWAALAADEIRAPGSSTSLQVVCAPDVPVARLDDPITLRAWVTDGSGNPVQRSLQYSWSTSAGSVTGGNVASWSIGQAEGASADVAKVTAKILVKHESLGEATCELLVYVAVPVAPIVAPRPEPERKTRSPARTRAFLLPGTDPPAGYGLYSYLLFDTPPKNDDERERFLQAIQSYLLILQPLEEMERYRRPSGLNIVLLPLKRDVVLLGNLTSPKEAAAAARQVLEAYDYGRAQALLIAFGKEAIPSGPFLVSTTGTGIESMRSSPRLFFDMSHVVPKLVWDWMKAFCTLAAQEPSWTQVSLTKLALNTRNVLAVAASDTPDVVTSLKSWVRVMAPE